jgi:hypothetical protein
MSRKSATQKFMRWLKLNDAEGWDMKREKQAWVTVVFGATRGSD